MRKWMQLFYLWIKYAIEKMEDIFWNVVRSIYVEMIKFVMNAFHAVITSKALVRPGANVPRPLSLKVLKTVASRKLSTTERRKAN